MRNWYAYIILLLCICVAVLTQSCIHEYPVRDGVYPPGAGIYPGYIYSNIEVVCDLSWQEFLHDVDLSTKAGRDTGTHRFVVEVSLNGEALAHDVVYLTDAEFAEGRMQHTVSTALASKEYEIAVWYDTLDKERQASFNADDAGNIYMINMTTVDYNLLECAYCNDVLDLRGVAQTDNGVTVKKELKMKFPGARFELVATDVQDFITQQKEALDQEDYYSVRLEILSGGYSGLNLYTDIPKNTDEDFIVSGRMRLPFDKYEELKIAEGFVFCRQEEEVTARLSILNSALVSVSRTETFSFPVKRGYITIVRGDFLTHPIESMVTIDHLWAGEIVFEI